MKEAIKNAVVSVVLGLATAFGLMFLNGGLHDQVAVIPAFGFYFWWMLLISVNIVASYVKYVVE